MRFCWNRRFSKIFYDSKGIPHIKFLNDEQRNNIKKKSKKNENNFQTIVTLEYGMWEDLKNAVGDTFDQIIPHREMSEDAKKAINLYQTQRFYDSSQLVDSSGKRSRGTNKRSKKDD